MYIELIFIENFFLDFIIIFTAAYSSSSHANLLFVFIASFSGALYSICANYFFIFNLFIIKIIYSFIICAISIRFCGLRNIMEVFIRYLSISFLSAGISFALKANNSFNSGIYKYISTGIISGIILYFSLIKKCYIPHNPCTIEIIFKNTSIIFSAIPDTGNLLQDEFGRGVIILDKKIIEKSLPQILLKNKNLKIKYFTVSTVAGSKQLLGIKPDCIYLTENSNKYTVNAYIVLAENINIDGTHAILSRGVRAIKIKENL